MQTLFDQYAITLLKRYLKINLQPFFALRLPLHTSFNFEPLNYTAARFIVCFQLRVRFEIASSVNFPADSLALSAFKKD